MLIPRNLVFRFYMQDAYLAATNNLVNLLENKRGYIFIFPYLFKT